MNTDPTSADGSHSASGSMLRHVAEGDLPGAYELVDTLLEQGWTLERIVTELLAEAQREVGARWQAGRWTVAREHAATAVVEDLLGSLGRHVPTPTRKATIALVCSEGEWHVSAARMAALLFRSHRWSTTFLGGSMPVPDLHLTLGALRPTFVAVSCTYPLFLPGAAEVAAVARRLDIPSLAGGQAFGDTSQRAVRLGFDGWAPSVTDASALLDRWLDQPPSPNPQEEAPGRAERQLEHRWSCIADQAIQRLANVDPPCLEHRAGTVEAVRRDLIELLRAAHVATACDDPSVFTDHVDWMTRVHPATGLPHAAIPASIRILRELSAPLGDRMRAILAEDLRDEVLTGADAGSPR